MSERIALIIGNSDYQDTQLSRLRAPEADLDALVSVLRDPKIGRFKVAARMINQPAREILRAIGELFHARTRCDLLLLYFVGQGVLNEKGRLYLVAADTKLDSLDETAIPAAYISGCMDRSFARQQILILDCVYAAATPGVEQMPGPNVGTGLAFEGKGYWRTVLSASDRTQYTLTEDGAAEDGEDSHFTHYLIRGLQTGAADLDGDGWISIGEMHRYVYRQAVEHTPNQEPCKWTYGEREEFIIGHNPEQTEPKRPIKWDVLAGTILVPLTTVFIGAWSNLGDAIGMAGMLLLIYALIYWALD